MTLPCHNRIRATLALLVLAVTGLLLSGCERDQTGPLRLGTNVWPGYEPLYLARDQGLLDPDRVHLVELTSASQVIQALHNELLDAAGVTLDEAIELASAGEDIAIVLVTDISNGADVILAHPGLTSLQELQGKTVGFEATALGSYMIVRATESAGVPLSSLHLTSFRIDEHERVFTNHEVDAIVTFEPVASALQQKGAVKLFDSSAIPGEVVDVVVVKRSALRNHRVALGYLVHAWYQALGRLRNNSGAAYAQISKRLALTPAETALAFDKLILPDAATNAELLTGKGPHSLRTTAQRLNEVMKQYRLVSGDIDTDRLFDASAVMPPP